MNFSDIINEEWKNRQYITATEDLPQSSITFGEDTMKKLTEERRNKLKEEMFFLADTYADVALTIHRKLKGKMKHKDISSVVMAFYDTIGGI